MGRRGPPPKPAHLKIIEGNPGKRPIKTSPQPKVGKVTCPEWLSPQAKAEWKRVAPELEQMGVVTSLDRAALAGYCSNYAAWVEATTFIQQNGEHYVTSKGMLRRWPQADTAKQAEQAMRGFASEIGLTPTARARLSVEPVEREEDEFETFLRSR